MGCSESVETIKEPTNPIQCLLYENLYREQQQRKFEKRRKRMQKTLKKLEKKKERRDKKERKRLGKHAKDFPQDGNGTSNASAANEGELSQDEKLNRRIKKYLSSQLDSDLGSFVLDQIIFSTEFFGNYESELTSILAEFLDKENKLNRNFEAYSFLLANPLDAAMAKWLNYKPVHGPNKNIGEPIQLPIVYVVFENFQLSRSKDDSSHSTPPLCKLDIITNFKRTTPCKEEFYEFLETIKSQGYVRLQIAKKFHSKANKNEVRTKESSKSEKLDGSNCDSDVDKDYMELINMNIHHPFKELKMSNRKERKKLSEKTLPDSCTSPLSDFIELDQLEDSDIEEFLAMKNSSDNDGNNSSSNKSREIHDPEKKEMYENVRRYKLELERHRILMQQKYLNSSEFMRYFGELLRRQFASKLNLRKEDLHDATYCGCSIYTRNFEIIPAIHVAQNTKSWPKCAEKFLTRQRPMVKDANTGQKIQWPTRAMLKQIESFGYHLIPSGFLGKGQKNPFRNIEWRIVFPKAESYLERHLSRTQVKILMIVKALVKTFIQPHQCEDTFSFTMDYFRVHLFWECERDCSAWSEEFMGDVVVRFIESFMNCLRHKRLRDFFIEERNLLESIPEENLMSLYKALSDIAENPLMHLMVAFRNLHFNEKFYPKLNFMKIFHVLTEDDKRELTQFSNSPRYIAESESSYYSDPGTDEDYPNNVVGMEDGYVIKDNELSQRACYLQYQLEMEKKKEIERKESVETIDIEFFFVNQLIPQTDCYDEIDLITESIRREILMEIFLDHLLAISESSLKFKNFELAQIWLSQAKRICSSYFDYGSDTKAEEYFQSIEAILTTVEEIFKGSETFDAKSISLPIPSSSTIIPDDIQCTNEISHQGDVTSADEFPLQSGKRAWESQNVRSSESSLSGSSSWKSAKSIKIKVDVHEIASSRVKKKRKERAEEETKIQIESSSDGKIESSSSEMDTKSIGKYKENPLENQTRGKSKNNIKNKSIHGSSCSSSELSETNAEEKETPKRQTQVSNLKNQELFNEKLKIKNGLSNQKVSRNKQTTKSHKEIVAIHKSSGSSCEESKINSSQSEISNRQSRVSRNKRNTNNQKDITAIHKISGSSDEESKTHSEISNRQTRKNTPASQKGSSVSRNKGKGENQREIAAVHSTSSSSSETSSSSSEENKIDTRNFDFSIQNETSNTKNCRNKQQSENCQPLRAKESAHGIKLRNLSAAVYKNRGKMKSKTSRCSTDSDYGGSTEVRDFHQGNVQHETSFIKTNRNLNLERLPNNRRNNIPSSRASIASSSKETQLSELRKRNVALERQQDDRYNRNQIFTLSDRVRSNGVGLDPEVQSIRSSHSRRRPSSQSSFKCLQSISIRAIKEAYNMEKSKRSDEDQDEYDDDSRFRRPNDLESQLPEHSDNFTDQTKKAPYDLKDEANSLRSYRTSESTKTKKEKNKKNRRNPEAIVISDTDSQDSFLDLGRDNKGYDHKIDIERPYSGEKKDNRKNSKSSKCGEISKENDDDVNNSKVKSFFGKFLNREELQKKCPMISSDMIDSAIETKETIKSLANKETRAKLFDAFKKKIMLEHSPSKSFEV